MSFEYISKTVEDTWKLAEKFAKCIDTNGADIFFLGEIGVGKTTFIKEFLKHFGVKEEVTSPSFVVMNEYHSAKIPVYHFDFYRLENTGTKSVRDELLQYSDTGTLTLIEWAEFDDTNIFDDKIIIKINYESNDYRKFLITAEGKNSLRVLKALINYENS